MLTSYNLQIYNLLTTNKSKKEEANSKDLKKIKLQRIKIINTHES